MPTSSRRDLLKTLALAGAGTALRAQAPAGRIDVHHHFTPPFYVKAMEKELAESCLDWYAVRPVKLTDGPLTERVQASDRFAMKPISRADVAWYMLTLAEDPEPRLLRTPILVSAQGSPARQSGESVVAGRIS